MMDGLTLRNTTRKFYFLNLNLHTALGFSLGVLHIISCFVYIPSFGTSHFAILAISFLLFKKLYILVCPKINVFIALKNKINDLKDFFINQNTLPCSQYISANELITFLSPMNRILSLSFTTNYKNAFSIEFLL